MAAAVYPRVNVMAYQVLARKWRPQTFAEVVGQEHITRTLQNAILQERVGHAYLFVGSRGIGKTTTARIFAKALNCEKGTVKEPCCQCQSCREIAAGSALDVMEIDGASHNRVEHIRDIRENVQYSPSRSRYKIYIIDEVHMLTPSAWNALLKTLEEPPSHVKFLFATTEPHKVLPTIVSRCQRFDLKRISVPLIVKRLAQIATEEEIFIEERALSAVARAADGGMRDAQSIFDQMIAFCGGRTEAEQITEQDVIDVFGLASGAELLHLTCGMLGNDVPQVLQVVQALADHGRDLERLYADLLYYVRNLMICGVHADTAKLLEVSDSELKELQQLTAGSDATVVQRLLQGLVNQEWSFRSALNKRVYLEAALIRVMREAHSLEIDEIIARLSTLQKNGETPKIIIEEKKVPVLVNEPAVHADQKNAGPDEKVPKSETQKTDSVEKELPDSRIEVEPDAAVEKDEVEAELTASEEVEAQVEAVNYSTASQEEPDIEEEEVREPEQDEKLTDRQDTVTATNDPEPQEQAGELENDAAHLWRKLIDLLRAKPELQMLVDCMKDFKPVSFRDGILQVGYDAEFEEEQLKFLQDKENQRLLQQNFAKINPLPPGRLLIKRWIDSISSTEKKSLQSTPEVRERVENHPFVREVCDLFDGRIVDVRG